MHSQFLEVDEHEVQLTNLDRVIWSDIGVTKAQLIEYHIKMAEVTIPYWRDRPLTITRHPNGIGEPGFYQKNCPEYTPEWVETVRIASERKEIEYLLVNNVATLVWLANQSAIEFHPATYRTSNRAIPSYAIIDLDPTDPMKFKDTVEIALAIRTVLEQLGLRGYPKTSGATGIHIYIPLQSNYTFAQTSRLVEFIGELLIHVYPAKVTNQRLLKNRRGIYIDHLQNLSNKTIVGVYSPRALPKASISTPVTWDELPYIDPLDFTILSIYERVQHQGDLFAPVLTDLQSITHILPMIDSK